ncbi:MAG: hypothetical protein FWD27_04435 [Coriobacteriia bacterium]|nr:hypothetical protein [Coriobacteriia bacterium]
MGLFKKNISEEEQLARQLKKESDDVYRRKHKPGPLKFSSGTATDPVFVRQIEPGCRNTISFLIELNVAQLYIARGKRVLPDIVELHFVYIPNRRGIILSGTQAHGTVHSFIPGIGKVMMEVEDSVLEHDVWPHVVRAWIGKAYYSDGSVWENPNAQSEGKKLFDEIKKHWEILKDKQ